jgi:hypothetical protein
MWMLSQPFMTFNCAEIRFYTQPMSNSIVGLNFIGYLN